MTTTTTETTSTETSTTEGETAGADGEAAGADGEAAGAESSTMTTTMTETTMTETTTTTLDSNSVTVAMATELLQDAISAQEIAQMEFDAAMDALTAAESGTTEEIEAATLVRDEAMMTLTSAMTFT